MKKKVFVRLKNNLIKEKNMKFFKYLFVLLSLILIVSCGGEEEDDWGNDGDGGNSGNNEENGGWESQEGQDWKILKTRGFTNIYSLTLGQNDTLYLGGTTLEDLYSDSLTETKKADALLVAFDTKGKELWGKQWDVHKQYDSVKNIVIDKDGYIYISGGKHVTFVMKFAPDGTKIWEQFPEFDSIHSLAVDGAKNVYISYESEIIKYSSDGKILQNYKVFGESSNPSGINALAIDSKGNIYAGGDTYDSLFTDNAGKNDAFLIKLAPDGTQLWGKQWGSDDEDYIYDLVIDEDNIYVGGLIFVEDTEIFLKFSPDGEKIWGQDKTSTSMIINNNEIYTINNLRKGIVNKYDLDGKLIGSSPIYEQESFDKIAGDSKGNIYVRTTKNKIIKFAPSDFK